MSPIRFHRANSRHTRRSPSSGSGQRRTLGAEILENRLMMSIDLVPTRVDAPALGSQAHTMLVETQVDNLGSRSSGSYTIQYRIVDLDGPSGATERVLATVARSSISAHGLDHWTQRIALPENLPQGRFRIGVDVDHRLRIPEMNEFNNRRLDHQSIYVLPGLPIEQCDSLGPEGTPFIAGVNCRVMEVDNYPRAFITYIPRGRLGDNQRVPLVFMFHGSSGNGGQFLKISGWREQADEEGLIAVFPTGAMYCRAGSGCTRGELSGWTTKWNDYGLAQDEELDFSSRPPGYPEGLDNYPADDIEFVRQMLDEMESLLPIDADRVFASGFSNGAGFTARIAVDLSDRIAAVGSFAGGLGNIPAGTVPARLIPIAFGLGTRDDRLLERLGFPPDGELPLDPTELLAIPEVAAALKAQLDLVQLAYDPTNFQPDRIVSDATFTLMRWETPLAGNTSCNSLTVAVLDDVTHAYPNGMSRNKNPHGFQAAEQFWQFFEQHSVPCAEIVDAALASGLEVTDPSNPSETRPMKPQAKRWPADDPPVFVHKPRAALLT